MTTAIPSSSAQATSSVFDKLNTKNQGFIDKAELTTAFADAGVQDMDVEAIDSDKDGKITKSEMTAGVENLIAQLESSALNGISSSGTTSTADDVFIPDSEISSEAAPKEASAPPTSKAESPVAGAAPTQNYDAADANQDGEVSVKEAVAYAAAQEAKTQETKTAAAQQEQTTQYNVAQAMQAYAYNAGTVENQVSTSA